MTDIDDQARAIAHAARTTFAIVGAMREDGTMRIGFGSGAAGMDDCTMLITAACLITVARQIVEVAAKNSGQSAPSLWNYVQAVQAREYPQINRSAQWWAIDKEDKG